MPINARCSQCGATLPVPDEFAGKAVRCGGCRSVVNVPMNSGVVPAPPEIPRARPVASPVVPRAKRVPKIEDEKPIRKARKAKPDEVEDEEADERESTSKRRPIAKRRRESVMTPTALKWLMLLVMTGVVGLGVLAFAAWGGSRKNDGTALIPQEAPPPRNAPAPPLQFDRP